MTADWLQQYWQALLRRLPQLLLVSAGVATVVFFVVSSVGAKYTIHFSYLVSLSEREEASEYRFDGFYALQATDLFAATLAKWAAAPEVINKAYQTAGLTPESADVRSLSRVVRAEKTAPQLVQLTIQAKDPETAERLADGLQEVMAENIDLYHDQGVPELAFSVIATEPWLSTQEAATTVIVIATFVAVFMLGVNVVLLVASLSEEADLKRNSRVRGKPARRKG